MQGTIQHHAPELSGRARSRAVDTEHKPEKAAQVALYHPVRALAPKHPAKPADTAEIGNRLIDGRKHRPVVVQHVATRAPCLEIQPRRALVARLRLFAAGKKTPFRQQAARQLCRGQGIKQADHADRDRRILDTLDHASGDAALFTVEAHDEARIDENPGLVDRLDALLQAAPRVLLFLHQHEGVRIRAFDADEYGKEIGIGQAAQQVGIIREVDGRLGRKFEGKILLILPAFQVGQEFLQRLLVADQVVINKIHMPSIPQRVQGIEFGHDLCIGLGARHPAIQFDNVTEFTTERTPARKLDADMQVLVQLQQVKAGQRAFRDIRLAHRRFEHALPVTLAPGCDEIDHDFLGFAQDLKIRGIVQRRAGCDIGAANHHRLVMGMAHFDNVQGIVTLRQHAAGHHDVGPCEIRLIQMLGIAVDQPDFPVFGQQGRNGNQAERCGRIARASQVTGFLVVPE